MDASAAEPSAGDPRRVRVRLVHGLINEPALEVCFDPDLQVDDPETPLDDGSEGPLRAQLLPIAGGFGDVSAYVELAPASSGALTFHRSGEGAVDGGLASPDEAGAGDAATESGPCAPETRELVVPLPFAPTLLDPTSPPVLAQLGVASELEGGSTVVLLGSGVALEGAALETLESEARAAYLASHPDDEAGAFRAGRAARARTTARVGPLFVPMRKATTALTEGSALSVAHLVHDVPSRSGAPGGLRLCITAGDVQRTALPEAGRPGFTFRLSAQATLALDGRVRHTFRVFAADSFDAEGKDCAGTSLAPIAELDVGKNRLASGRSYTLVALGAVDADAVCLPESDAPLARASCDAPSSELAARLVLVDND